MGSPEAAPAQPRALVGGHLLSMAIGLLVLHTTGAGPWAAAAAVGLAIVVMHLTRTFHPPAGIDPLVVVVNDMQWSFPGRPGRDWRLPARRLRLRLAQRRPARLVAEALVVNAAQVHPAATSVASRARNLSPSPVTTTLRR